jgi:hypothetical protein
LQRPVGRLGRAEFADITNLVGELDQLSGVLTSGVHVLPASANFLPEVSFKLFR